MTEIELIYCADGNRCFAEIAIEIGFHYGARLPPRGLSYPIYFADQDWKQPDRETYISELAKHQPHLATVLDWEMAEQLPEVLAWAEDAAVYVQEIIIIPKVFEGIKRLPRSIGGKRIRLGYSVPTRYGGTQTPIWEFAGWPVHLLGGSPHKQMSLARYLNVVSADGNMTNLMATRYCQYWVAGTATYARDRWWPRLREANSGNPWIGDAPYEAFRRSCENVRAAWGNMETYGQR